MKNQKVQFVIVTVLLIAVVVLLIPSMTQAKPKGIPWQNNEEQRDGYSQTFNIEANSPLIEVPEGKYYVLLRLYVRATDSEPPELEDWDASLWTLTLDGEMFLDEYSLNNPFNYSSPGVYIFGLAREDFPDKCVVVKGGQTLGVTRPEAIEHISMTLIGYFCDAP